jgi:SAM-dependent methyltransferase
MESSESKFTVEDIHKLYESEAERHGLAGTSTIQDIRTRQLEMNAIFRHLRDGLRVLEIGCGNGYVAEEVVRNFDVELDAFDFSPEMIALARTRTIEGARGRVRFYQDDAMTFEVSGTYDLIFSERCVQNLETWSDQQQSLKRIADALADDGRYVMLESFWTGLNNLNAARAEFGLDPIPESWHNRFFDEPETRAYMASLGLEVLQQDCFLSGYYFGSRVLRPALTPPDRKVTSASIVNDFFVALPPAGDFSPMKILVFGRRR